MNKILEECLKELLSRQSKRLKVIYFSMHDALTINDLPDTNIRKNPKIRYIQGVELTEEGFIRVLVLTPTTDGRSKHKLNKYPYSAFTNFIQSKILQLAIRESIP